MTQNKENSTRSAFFAALNGHRLPEEKQEETVEATATKPLEVQPLNIASRGRHPVE